MTLAEAHRIGFRRVRQPTWADDVYLELTDIGGFLSPIGRLRCKRLEESKFPELRWDPIKNPANLHRLPDGDRWVAYEGETAADLPPL